MDVSIALRAVVMEPNVLFAVNCIQDGGNLWFGASHESKVSTLFHEMPIDIDFNVESIKQHMSAMIIFSVRVACKLVAHVEIGVSLAQESG